jgi:uncharacterized membrane-anchored protein
MVYADDNDNTDNRSPCMIKGQVKKDSRTKNLISRLNSGDIAVIDHQDLDEVAAIHLVEKRVRAVVNCSMSISGKYPNQGPKILCDAGIPIIDNIGSSAFHSINENDMLEITNGALYCNGKKICKAELLESETVQSLMEEASQNLMNVLHDFIDNTLDYAEREKEIVTKPINLPKLKVNMRRLHVLIIVRGKNYKEDLRAIRSYIEEMNPVMIAVDGGGDALIECGMKPDIIVGDMDSVSDRCLKSCDELVVHAYPDGHCPGMERINKLGLKAVKFPFAGTSEDAALILAFENQADLIVVVGSHTSMIDFLEKGRRGMASTFLVRLKVGYKVIDAKGVSELYKNRLKPVYLAALFVAAMFPIAMVARMSPQIQELYQLIVLRIRLLIGL